MLSKSFSNQNFGVWYKTDSAVPLIPRKKQGIQGQQELPFLIYFRKLKICIQFILIDSSPLSFLLSLRKKININKFLKCLLINFTVQPSDVSLVSYLLISQKVFCSNFIIVRLLPWYFVNSLIHLVTLILKRLFVLFLVVCHFCIFLPKTDLILAFFWTLIYDWK